MPASARELMASFDPGLAAKLLENGATLRGPIGTEQRPNGTAPRKIVTAPVQLPVEVREQSSKPKKLEVITTSGISKKTGKPYKMMVAAPGFAIARVIFNDIDHKRKLARTIVIVERRKGRPANSQRCVNGATEE